MRIRTAVLGGIGAVVVALAIAGCGGGDDENDGGTTAAQAPAAGGRTLTIEMADYSFTPNNPTTNAGTVTISTPNKGQLPHELVLLKTDKPPTSLPTKGNEIDEEGLEASGVESPGEIEDVGAGETKSGKFELTAGKYVMICNLPGHFAKGMYGTITVK